MSYPNYNNVPHAVASITTMTHLDEDSYHVDDRNCNNGDACINFSDSFPNENYSNRNKFAINNNTTGNDSNSSVASTIRFEESNSSIDNKLEEDFSHFVDKLVMNEMSEDVVTTTTATLNQPLHNPTPLPQRWSLLNLHPFSNSSRTTSNGPMKQLATAPSVYSTTSPQNMATSSPEDVERLLANDLTKLSFREREQAMEDVHGIVTKPPQEQPEQSEALLQQLQQHLDAMQWLPEASAYRRAIQIDSNFVRWKRIMFLRAEQYQPQEAATRMIKYFTMKLELWGSDKLCRKIRLNDLSPDDYYALQQGISSISPYKDTAGRSIICAELSLNRQQIKDRNCLLRANWYVYMSTVEENTDAQFRGVVFVALDIPPQYRATGMGMRDTLPVKFSALHAHYLMDVNNNNNGNDSNGSRKVVPVVMIQCAKEQSLQKRVRYRSYTGSRMEALYEMMRFGIPTEAAPPLGIDGEPTNTRQLEWIEKRRQWECEQQQQQQTPPQQDHLKTSAVAHDSRQSSMVPSSSIIALATSSSSGSGIIADSKLRLDDVLFGKEKSVVNHPGNTRFRQLIDMYLPSYESAPRGEKTRITKAIVEHIQSSSGRFLKRGPSTADNNRDTSTVSIDLGWVEVDAETAYDKITHAFRNRRKYLQMRKI
jgi:hypothetical protein